jgi:hypothetical protein
MHLSDLMHASETLCTGLFKSQVHKQLLHFLAYVVTNPTYAKKRKQKKRERRNVLLVSWLQIRIRALK